MAKSKNPFSSDRLLNYCHEALTSIRNNKLRSILSILGIMIGVAAVITMLSLGSGAKKSMQENFSSLGTNLLNVRMSRSAGGVSLGGGTFNRFNFEDLDTIKTIENVENAVPYVSGRAQSVFQNRNWNTSVIGTSVDYPNVKNAEPQSGRFFSELEAAGSYKVAVIGVKVKNELFGDENPLGNFIRVNRVSFKVIGVLPEKGVAGFQNQDDQIVIPLKTAMNRLLGKDYIDYFEVTVKDLDSMPKVQEDIKKQIMKSHRLLPAQEEAIDIRNMAEIQKAAGEMINTLSFLLAAIAGVSLLVGGIGIMNIMLVMVMERTREIGLRKALGAKKSDILIQFLVESILICLFGGVIGIIFGSLFSWGISYFAGWNTLISAGSIILGFAFSVFVGLIFGIWPAWRASNLLPIEALRYE